jgi:hypothetical protein
LGKTPFSSETFACPDPNGTRSLITWVYSLQLLYTIDGIDAVALQAIKLIDMGVPVEFDWPHEPLPRKEKGKKRKKGDIDGEKQGVDVETNKEERSSGKEEEKVITKVQGNANVTGEWSNDITFYKGSIHKDNIAAVLKGVSPFTYCHGCEYAHTEVIYSLKVVARSPRLTLASASLDGSIRTWEPYSTRVRRSYELKKPRKGAGDWTCASVMETPVYMGQG